MLAICISHEAYYQKLRDDPEFTDKMSKAQQLASVTARTNILAAIKKGDVSASKWWLERKDKEEFSSKTDIAVQEQEVIVKSEEEELIELELNLDTLSIYKWKARKHALINNYCIGYGIEKAGPLNRLYALSNEELVKLAMRDIANGTYDTPDVEGVFTADKGPMKSIEEMASR